jgi:hypothetical protein
MKFIKSFNERYQPTIVDILSDLKDYFISGGTYTESLLDYSIMDNTLYIDIDIASAFDGGRTERERVKGRLKRFGFEWAGDSSVSIKLSDSDLEEVKSFFNMIKE